MKIAKYRKVFSPKVVVATFGTRFREIGDSGRWVPDDVHHDSLEQPTFRDVINGFPRNDA